MNRIVIENDTIIKKEIDDTIVVEETLKNDAFTVNTIHIEVVKDTQLSLSMNMLKASKLNLYLQVNPHTTCFLTEVKTGEECKIQWQYDVSQSALLQVQKIGMNRSIREHDLIYLNGTKSEIEMYLKTIGIGKEKYDIVSHHRASDTKSNLVSHGVTKNEGTIIFHVTGVVPQKIKNCVLNQTSRIILGGEKECVITPNLLIDEPEVIANHAALMGRFSKEELFYLESRGLKESLATELLVKGFILSGLKLTKEQEEKLIPEMEKYWR